MKVYITESTLREQYSLGDSTELQLPFNSVLTPAARDLLDMRNITVKYKDEHGSVFIEDKVAAEKMRSDEVVLKKVHALTSDDQKHSSHCTLCQQALEKKPDTLTHLNADKLISKNDPRIKFRSEVDSAIALAVWLQTEFAGQWPETYCQWLADIRSNLGNIMKAEVTGSIMPSIAMGDLNEEAIHKMSHNPLKLIGYDHIVPDAKHGKIVAQLNLLRTKIREVETTAATVFIGRDFVVERPDIMQGLNRLSSAVYVLMIMTIVTDNKGQMPEGAR